MAHSSPIIFDFVIYYRHPFHKPKRGINMESLKEFILDSWFIIILPLITTVLSALALYYSGIQGNWANWGITVLFFWAMNLLAYLVKVKEI